MRVKTDGSHGDEYQVNDGLSSKHRLIKIPVPVQEEAHNQGRIF